MLSSAYSRLQMLTSLDKSIRSVYYTSTYALLLLKTLNARAKRKKRAKQGVAEKERFRLLGMNTLSSWRDTLLWAQALLQVRTAAPHRLLNACFLAPSCACLSLP